MTPVLCAASEYDCLEIFDSLLRLLDKSPAKQMALAEPDHAYRALKQAAREQRLYVYGDYAILVDVGSPWHTTKLVLIEEIIVRFRRTYGNPVESVVEQLEVLARLLGCVAIAAGDTQIGIMGPRYLAAGYSTLGTQFYKEMA